jgi:hypothetical protein
MKLGVSPGQISKWKSDEYMSHDMQARLRELAKIGDVDPGLIVWAGSVKAAKQWRDVMQYTHDATHRLLN